MGQDKTQPHQTINVMEFLVTEEVDRHIKQLSPKLSQYINRVEVMTYALNRLPPLYACSYEGWERQHARANQALQEKITIAVRRGIAAIQRDPLRTCTPLTSQTPVTKKLPLPNPIPSSPEQDAKLQAVQAAHNLRRKLQHSLAQKTQPSFQRNTLLKSQRSQTAREGAWNDASYSR